MVHGFGLRVTTRGSGHPLIWAHDVLSSIDDDDADGTIDFDRLAANRRLIRYDAIGHGRSAGIYDPADHEWSSRGDELLELLERLELTSAALGGLGAGAATALWAAHLDPSRVDRLVLCGLPVGWLHRAPATGLRSVLGTGALVGMAEPMRIAARLLPVIGAEGGVLARHRAAGWRRMVRARRERFVAVMIGAARSNLPPVEALGALDIPTLVLAHRGDPFHPVRTSIRVAEAMPDAELLVADTDDDVARWAEVIAAFLR